MAAASLWIYQRIAEGSWKLLSHAWWKRFQAGREQFPTAIGPEARLAMLWIQREGRAPGAVVRVDFLRIPLQPDGARDPDAHLANVGLLGRIFDLVALVGDDSTAAHSDAHDAEHAYRKRTRWEPTEDDVRALQQALRRRRLDWNRFDGMPGSASLGLLSPHEIAEILGVGVTAPIVVQTFARGTAQWQRAAAEALASLPAKGPRH